MVDLVESVTNTYDRVDVDTAKLVCEFWVDCIVYSDDGNNDGTGAVPADITSLGEFCSSEITELASHLFSSTKVSTSTVKIIRL